MEASTTLAAPTGSPFQQAYASAKSETSAPAEQSPALTPSPEASPAPTPNEPSAPASEVLAAATPTDDLISDTDLAALEATHADDPKALAKALKGAYTKKTQAHAARVKADDADLQFARDFHANPSAAISRLAPTLGLTVMPTAAERREAATTKTVQTITDAATSKLSELLGPELGAEFGTVLRAVAEETAKSVVAPLVTEQSERAKKDATEQQAQVWNAFATKHPDWQTHEAKIVALGKRFSPTDGANLGEYMDSLYDLATMDTKIAAGVQAKIDQMTQGAKAADVATRTVPDAAIQQAPRKIRNFRDAYEDTKAEQARGGAR